MRDESFPTSSPVTEPPWTNQRSPITLAFLFYLVTFGGIVSSCLGTLSVNEGTTRESLQLALAVCGGLGMAIGFFLGLLRFRRWSLAGLGMLSGAVIGAIAGALTRISVDNFLQINLIACSGSWLMIVVMCLAARYRSPLIGRP